MDGEEVREFALTGRWKSAGCCESKPAFLVLRYSYLMNVNRDMTFDDFRESLQRDGPPRALDRALTALWWDAKGDWKTAHESAQQDENPRAAWVHAYLHRKEGDLSNASYWYSRAGKDLPQSSLEHEWREITKALLAE